ncbi:MAG: hypothetical protein ABJL17_08780 [Parvibaculum sp.]|jgi:hypothetical protein|uniref:hypothetical protein n=1 Tax=Parvibaculum sp. TaxID=2024848 RepID=UPI003266908E
MTWLTTAISVGLLALLSWYAFRKHLPAHALEHFENVSEPSKCQIALRALELAAQNGGQPAQPIVEYLVGPATSAWAEQVGIVGETKHLIEFAEKEGLPPLMRFQIVAPKEHSHLLLT